MKLASVVMLLFLSSASFAQVPDIELSSSATCIGDTMAISYKVSNVQTINWSTSGDGHFVEKKTTVTSSTGYTYYVPKGGDLSGQTILIAAAASSADQTVIRTHATKTHPFPFVSFTCDSTIYPNTEASFRNFSSIQSGGVVKYTLDYGDGVVDTFDGSFRSTEHYYNRPGDFEVILCATSDIGCENCASQSLKSAWRASLDEHFIPQDFSLIYQNGQVEIQYQGVETFDLRVYGLDGKAHFAGAGQIQYAFSPKHEGVYLFQILTESGPVSFKYAIGYN